MQEHKASEDRIVMLSDAVFAIAITLLVLDIRIPDGLSTPDAFNAILTTDFLTKTVFYVVTFLIIARYWLSHRRLTKVTEHIDKLYLSLNLVFLAFIAFLPAVTNIVSVYGYTWSIIPYIAVLVGCGYMTTILWAYVLKKPLITSHKFSQLSINLHIFNAAVIPTLFLCSLLLLLVPTLSMHPARIFYSWIGIPIILFILKRILAKKTTEQEISDHEFFNV